MNPYFWFSVEIYYTTSVPISYNFIQSMTYTCLLRLTKEIGTFLQNAFQNLERTGTLLTSGAYLLFVNFVKPPGL